MNNREVKFRAKTKVTNEWIYGFYYEIPAPLKCIGKQEEPKGCMIIRDPNSCPDWGMPIPLISVEIDRGTVGQYTGIQDKDSKKIYEGDIVKIIEVREQYKKEELSISECIANVFWDREGYYVYDSSDCGLPLWEYGKGEIFLGCATEAQILGNIYDNPELINALSVGDKYVRN